MSAPRSTPCPSTGCVDRDGKPIPNATSYFLEKDRLFDPTQNPRYANDLGLPYLLLKQNPVLDITHLHVGLEFGGEHVHNGIHCAEKDTLVMVVASREMNGRTAGARWFANDSRYNANSLVGTDSIVNQILLITCVGCNTIRDVCDKNPTINKAYIMTSSEELVEAVAKLFVWTKDGFPNALPGGMSPMLLGLLRGHLQSFDAKGIEVKFWKVAPEFITGPSFYAENQLLDFFDVPNTATADTCHCGDCIDSKQYAEMEFAKFGMACCPCPSGIKLAVKYGHLKKGDKFVLTNNAGVTTPTVVMRWQGNAIPGRLYWLAVAT